MKSKRFCCFGDDGYEMDNMPCCGNMFHKKCHERWIADRYYCGFCRRSIDAVQPMPALDRERLRTTEYLLGYVGINCRTATIIGTGELVDDQDLIRYLQAHIGPYAFDIERRGPNQAGYQPGRLVKVTYWTQCFKFPILVDQGHKKSLDN